MKKQIRRYTFLRIFSILTIAITSAVYLSGCLFQSDHSISSSEDSTRSISALAAEIAALKNEISSLHTESAAIREKLDSSQKNYGALLDYIESNLPDIPTSSAPSEESSAFSFDISGVSASVTGYSGNNKDISIPSEASGKPVSSIAKEAFVGTSVSSVTLPDSVTSIGWFAFSGCRNLKKIYIPDSVTSIEYGAFNGCNSLVIHCSPDSFAAKYAKSYGIDTVIEN